MEVDFTNWQRSKSYDELFKDIKSAIINKNIVRLIYFSSNKKETSRKVKPIRLLFKGWDWYVYAFCLSRNDFRYFKLSRIKEFEILPNTFEDDFDSIVLKKEMEYEETVFVKVKFDRKMAFRVYDEVSSAIEEDEDGNLYATVELPNDYNLYNYIFSYGDAAEVLEPKEIRDKIKNIINIMAKKYRI
ncbi:TPA: WYL domain-containing protein [Streptococcus agalactiae]|uniref:WYL domain-containing protein n=1 Tax=Streptococcus infantis TaxID=68892 RepID=UPI003832764E